MGRLKTQRGQASIFMAVFISTMILLFAFTTNIGMLVHAKINLQNAADAAAFAGASVQARQLTSIAYLNWEMRRALKQFLFNWVVRGNQSQTCFPDSGSGRVRSSPNVIAQCLNITGETEKKYQFRIIKPTADKSVSELAHPQGYGYLPTSCVLFDIDLVNQNNYCQISKVAGIPRLGSVAGNIFFSAPLMDAVRDNANEIIAKKKKDCESRAHVNTYFLMLWLLNLNQSVDPLTADEDDKRPDTYSVAFFERKTLDSLGVLPRQAILRARIENLAKTINMKLETENLGSSPSSSVDDQKINTLINDDSKEKDFSYFERPIQAYLSARNNLPTLEHNGIFSNITLTELLPSSSINPLIKLDDITRNVVVSTAIFQAEGDAGKCSQFRMPFRIPKFLLGVSKDPKVLTYYAVRLQATARLLFSPFGLDGSVTLSAFSAAKPFGSRIGPNINYNESIAYGATHEDDVMTGEFRKKHQFLNPLVSTFDTKSGDNGFSSNGHLGYLRGAIIKTGWKNAYYLAGAYAPWEVGNYTVPANFEGLSFFANNPIYEKKKRFILRAPLYPIDQNDGTINFLASRINEMFSTEGLPLETFADIGLQEQFQKEGEKKRVQILADVNLGKLQNFLVLTGQDMNHHMPDPLLLNYDKIQTYVQNSVRGKDYSVAARESKEAKRLQLTSWNTVKSSTNDEAQDTEIGPNIGRSGYSVRFISFPTLLKSGKGGNEPNYDNTSYSGPLEGVSPSNPEAQGTVQILPKLKH